MDISKCRELSERSLQHHDRFQNAFLITTQEIAVLSAALVTTVTAGQVTAHTPFPVDVIQITPKSPVMVEEPELLRARVDDAIDKLPVPSVPPLGVPDISVFT